MRLLRLIAALALPAAIVAAGKPRVYEKTLATTTRALFYFEDSTVILAFDPKNGVGDILRSDDDGKTWDEVPEVKGKAVSMNEHPFDNQRAIVFTDKKEHWVTKDKGKSWKKFEVELALSLHQSPIAFNSKNSDYALYSGTECDSMRRCRDKTYYTTDWFDSSPKLLTENTHGCLFARGNKLFQKASDSTTLCIVDGDDKLQEHRKLLVSENLFKDSIEPKLDGYSTIRGLAGLASVSKFLIAAVRSTGTEEMALYVSGNATNWDRAEFPKDHGELKEDAYTILESTPYSIQVDVLTTNKGAPIGELFTSNSNGTYFTRNLENTNRIPEGQVDFEQIEGISGIILANIVSNAKEVKEAGRNRKVAKKLKTKISFDDGKMDTWKSLKADKDELHLHSVTELVNGGRVFSSRAPGIVMGVGNIGEFLGEYNDGDLYISDDAGLTWSKTLDEAYMYEFGGSGSIIVAAYDEGVTNEVTFSKNHGKSWEHLELGTDVRAKLLTTTPDSTSLKFLLVGTSKDKKTHIFALDFNDVFDRKCKFDKENEDKSDYEKWYARLDSDGKPDCLMGAKQFFWRRKKEADCSAGELFKDPEAESEVCECQDQDYECDFNFVHEDGKCVLAKNTKLPIPPNECKKPTDTYKGPSGYRKIPGNVCINGKKNDDLVERKCDEAISAPSTGKILASSSEFHAKMPVDYFYLNNAESAVTDEETVIMMTEKQEVWVSHDGGKEWKQVLKDVKVISIYPNPHFYDHVYFITNTKKVYSTNDRARTIKQMDKEMEQLPNRKGIPVMDFHPKRSGWIIYHGERECTDNLRCHTGAYYTTSYGASWQPLMMYSGLCRWIRGKLEETHEKLIFCEHEAKEGGVNQETMELISSTNFFEDQNKLFDKIIGYATMQEFIVVAGVKDDKSLQASTSVDGISFADAKFPHGFNVPHQTAYTVLDSVTHSIFLHVTVNEQPGFEFGSLLKSNSNGTDYVLSQDAVNRNEDGFVDFEKMQSLEGIAIINRVVNSGNAAKGEKKKLRSMITHNDGGIWKFITPPEKDSEGKKYKCSSSNLNKCSLNLHHYTERTDPRHTFSSGSAIGLMMGVGNVGDELTGFSNGDTFLTTDGGLKWKEVRKGQYLWEYGDQGSIIVIVDRAQPTDMVYYTLDEGETWQEYKFGDKMRVSDISTVTTDNSRRFLLWGYKEGGREKFYTVHLDFKGITDVQCNFNEGKGDDDFYLWRPRGEGHCLFGHEAEYHRKIASHRCYIGRKLERFHKTLKNCTCVDEDYECDFNFARASDGTCKLVAGLSPPDHAAVCANKDVVEYFKPTGYRRLPASTCEGGKELDKVESVPCPGKEEQWKKKHSGIGGFGIFMIAVLSLAAAGAAGWYVWTRVIGGRFGAIRLGEDAQDNLAQYPIIAISAVVAVTMAIPGILAAIGRWVGARFTRPRRYTTRSSFARGRGDYSVVNNDDEGELLGSDDEDDV